MCKHVTLSRQLLEENNSLMLFTQKMHIQAGEDFNLYLYLQGHIEEVT